MPKRAHPCDQELAAYVHGQVKGKRAAKLVRHFQRCHFCQDLIRILQEGKGMTKWIGYDRVGTD